LEKISEITQTASNVGTLAPSWELFILLFFAVCIGYSLILGRAKISGIMLSTYVALAIANETGDLLYGQFINYSQGFSASIFTFKTVLFGLIILFFTLKNENIKIGEPSRGLIGMLISTVYGFLSAGLIITSIATFMSSVQKEAVLGSSSLAYHLISARVVWLLAPVIFIILFSVADKKKK
jgi:hypothetical protein